MSSSNLQGIADRSDEPPSPSISRRAARNVSPKNYFESPLSAQKPEDHIDRTFVYSGQSPVHSESEPSSYQDPLRNIRSNESPSQADKDFINEKAPDGLKCVVTHADGGDVQFCHLLQRSTDPAIIRTIEWYLGLAAGELYVNLPWNLICLIASLHHYFDRAGFLLLPVENKVWDNMLKLIRGNTKVAAEKRMRYDQSELDLPPRKAYQYRLYPLDMPDDRRWSRVIRGDSVQFTDYDPPYNHPDLQVIKSHIHPLFALLHAGQNLRSLRFDRDPRRMNLYHELTDEASSLMAPLISLVLSIITPMLIPNSFEVPAAFREAHVRDPAIPLDVVDTTPRRPKKARALVIKPKDKGKEKAHEDGKSDTNPNSQPSFVLEPPKPRVPLQQYLWKVMSPAKKISQLFDRIQTLLPQIDSNITIEEMNHGGSARVTRSRTSSQTNSRQGSFTGPLPLHRYPTGSASSGLSGHVVMRPPSTQPSGSQSSLDLVEYQGGATSESSEAGLSTGSTGGRSRKRLRHLHGSKGF
ncbi:hypothetical protein D9757_011341 [Collybiopsis confluens]|uniref:HNH nuclease domain-containing protein n=1 Tax=Collybiopsis confluens TaxID=2823264 RepID=A0A8H5GGC9_9AGAR|nr:hypothetical protein D9757_011341 [Collybiopsis confluens]